MLQGPDAHYGALSGFDAGITGGVESMTDFATRCAQASSPQSFHSGAVSGCRVSVFYTLGGMCDDNLRSLRFTFLCCILSAPARTCLAQRLCP